MQTCHHWKSAVRSHKHWRLKLGEWRKSQEANWEEMPIWFWFTNKEAEMKGLQEKNPKSFHPSEPREQKRQNWYFISLLNSLFLRACMRVEKALLCSHSTLFMPRPQFFLFSRTVSKFQFHPFFKLLTFSTEAGVEELIHQSEAPRFHRLHVSLHKTVKHPLLVCRCVCACVVSGDDVTQGFLGESLGRSVSTQAVSLGDLKMAACFVRYWPLGHGPSRPNRYQQLKLMQTIQIPIIHLA